MKWAALALRFPFAIQFLSDRESIGVQLDDAVDGGPVLINLVDAGLIFLYQRTRRELAGVHAILQLRDRDLIEFECLHFRNRRRG